MHLLSGLIILGMMWLFANYIPNEYSDYKDEPPCDDPVILKCVEDVKNKVKKEIEENKRYL